MVMNLFNPFKFQNFLRQFTANPLLLLSNDHLNKNLIVNEIYV